MGNTPAQWRISRPAKDGISLVRCRWDATGEERAEYERPQREFADKLAEFMRENGYSGTIITPWPLQNVKVEREA